MTMHNKRTFIWISLVVMMMLLSSLSIALVAAQSPSPSPSPSASPTPPVDETLELAISVDDATYNERTGLAEVAITVSCSEPAYLFFVSINVTQPVSRTQSVQGFDGINGYPFDNDVLMCDGQEAIPFMVVPENGMFGEGPAFVRVNAFGCTEIPMMHELDAWIQPGDSALQEPVPGPEPSNCDSARTLEIPDLAPRE